MIYVELMILIVEESPALITFENTRSGFVFDAWLKEESTEWTVTKQGAAETWGKPEVWGRAELRDGTWYGYAGNLAGTEAVRCDSREDAFAWITNDRSADRN